MARQLTWDEVPTLPGYLTVGQISAMYGVHKHTIYYMVFETKRFQHVYKVTSEVPGGERDHRPVLMILAEEVKRVMEEREKAESSSPDMVKQLTQWHRRVKAWGRDTGWTQTPITPSGPPHLQLQAAYLQANPDDRKPGS